MPEHAMQYQVFALLHSDCLHSSALRFRAQLFAYFNACGIYVW